MSAVDATNGLVSILLDVVTVLPLIGLLYVGRASRHRRLVLVAAGAVVAALAGLALGRLADFARPVPVRDPLGTGYLTLALARGVAVTMAEILTIAAWVLLLYAALQARRNGWLFAMAVAVALTLVVPLVAPLTLGGWLDLPLLALCPIAALVCAWLLPIAPAIDRSMAERPVI